jgi:hypothetical protein
MESPSEIARIAEIAQTAKIEDERNHAARVAEGEEWNKRRQARLKIARQELPGVNSPTIKSRQGRLNSQASAVPTGTVLFSLLTRQFQPGFFQTPLPGLDLGLFESDDMKST